LLAGAFDLSKIEPQYDQQGRQILIDWLPLRYFANIAAEATIRKEKIIADTINGLKSEVIEGRLFVDDYTVYMVYKSLGALKNYIFDQSDVDFLNCYYAYAPHGQFPLHESYLLETLPENYIHAGKKEGLINLLCYCLGFRVAEEKLEGFEDIGIYSQRRVSPNLNTVTHHHVIDGLL